MTKLTQKNKAINSFLLHIHPVKVNEEAIKFNRTFGLGGINVILILLLSVTGILLRFFYVPTPEEAYNSIVLLQENVLFGKLLRNTHYISANVMIVTSFLHFIRTFFSQSIYFERSKNWVYGLLLMLLVLFSNFTGYLLPWDQLGYWAVTIMTNMLEYIPIIGTGLANLFRAGTVVNETTLINYYTLHTGVFPLLFLFFITVHFWLVRKAKGVLVPPNSNTKLVNSNPHLVSKEIMVALIVLALLFIMAIFIDAPLLDKASTITSPNPNKAPWYFMGVQELLLHIHPVFAVFIIPLLLTGFFFSLPYFKYKNLNIGVWFNSPKGKIVTLSATLFSIILTFTLILLSEYILKFAEWFPNLPVIINNGLFPFLLYLTPVAGFLYLFHKIKQINRVEINLALFSIIITSYMVMIVVGMWFRGIGMVLIW